MEIAIRLVTARDHDEWLRMRAALWPSEATERLRAEIAVIAKDPRQPVFVAVRPDGGLCGMVEVSIHPSALGCETPHVGYIEGWQVDPDMRRRGIGRMLMRTAEEWARAQGCREMASDTDADRTTSIAAHRALGYEAVEDVLCFHKRLG